MKKLLSIICLLAVTAILLPLLVSCGGYKSKYDTVMEYNGIKITEELYNYWISTFKRNILASYSDASDTEEFWSSKFNDNLTVEEYFTEILNERIMNYLISQDLYKENSLKLSSAVKKQIENDIQEKIEFYGGRGNLNSELSSMMLNVNALKEIYTWEAKHDLVYNYLFGEGGALEMTDKEMTDYYTANYSRIKYVVFYTTDIELDDNGDFKYDNQGNLISKPLSEEDLAKKNAKINEFENKLDDGIDFESLIVDYSEYDTTSYPDGFFVSANDIAIWGPGIVPKVKEMAEGDVRRIDEEEAVFFIYKMALTPFEDLSEADVAQLTDLKFTSYVIDEKYDEFFAQMYSSVKINSEVISKYRLSKVKPNPHYAI